MKNIIIAQLLLWLNLATVIIGWKIVTYFSPPEGVQVLSMILGLGGTFANLVFSIAIQARAYNKMDLTKFE